MKALLNDRHLNNLGVRDGGLNGDPRSLFVFINERPVSKFMAVQWMIR